MDEFTNQNNNYIAPKLPVLAHLGSPARLAVAFSLVVIGILVFSVIGIGISFFIFGIKDMEHLNFAAHLNDPVTINILKLVQGFSSIGGFVIPALLFAYLISGNFSSYLKMNNFPKWQLIPLVIALVLTAGPLINFLAELNSRMHLPGFMAGIEQWMRNSEDEAARITTVFLKMNGPADLVVNLFIIAFLAAVGEELLFRGVIQSILKEWTRNTTVAIWITAILFSAFHFQFFGFIPRMLLGVLLGYLFQWSNSIWLSALAHFINNAAAVIVSYFVTKGDLTAGAETIGSAPTDWLILIISTIGVFFLLRYIFIISRNSTKYLEPKTMH